MKDTLQIISIEQLKELQENDLFIVQGKPLQAIFDNANPKLERIQTAMQLAQVMIHQGQILMKAGEYRDSIKKALEILESAINYPSSREEDLYSEIEKAINALKPAASDSALTQE